MNFGFLFIFLLIQMGVNYLLNLVLIPYLDFAGNPIFANLTVSLISSLLIAFFGALLATPRGYRKEFFKNGNINYFLIALEMDKIAELKQINQQKETEQDYENQDELTF